MTITTTCTGGDNPYRSWNTQVLAKSCFLQDQTWNLLKCTLVLCIFIIIKKNVIVNVDWWTQTVAANIGTVIGSLQKTCLAKDRLAVRSISWNRAGSIVRRHARQ